MFWHVVGTIFVVVNLVNSSSISRNRPPLLLLISLDGFRFDLLNASTTPNLYKFAKTGVKFQHGVRSQYTTYTAPNHASIVTGLLQQHHGIVGNTFYDHESLFDIWNTTNTADIVNASLQAKWYNGEPIWLTNERSCSDRRSGSLRWPMGEAYYPVYSRHDKPQPNRILSWSEHGNLTTWKRDFDIALEWFNDTDDSLSLNFIAWYISQPDHILHERGFNSIELNATIASIDLLFEYIMQQMDVFKLNDRLNIIVTADHGHSQTTQIVCISDIISLDNVRIGDHMLYIDNRTQLEDIYSKLNNAIHDKNYGYKVWKRDSFPKNFGYADTDRVGDLIIEPLIGWAVPIQCTRRPNMTQVLSSATHGYTPNAWQMRALLLMTGPAFAIDRQIDEIPENIDLYQLMCHVLAIDPSPNNGSMNIVQRALRYSLDNRYSSSMWSNMLSDMHHLDTIRLLIIICVIIIPTILFIVYVIAKCRSRNSLPSNPIGYSRLSNGNSITTKGSNRRPISGDGSGKRSIPSNFLIDNAADDDESSEEM